MCFVEQNLIAIGNDVRRETGNDVFKTDPQLNEWMQRVKKLGGGSVDLDDDERAKRLEEASLNHWIQSNCRKSLHSGKRDRNDGMVFP